MKACTRLEKIPGRAKADITKWVEYFIEGMAYSFEKVKQHAEKESAAGQPGESELLAKLDARQKKVLELFSRADAITAKEVGAKLGVKERMARLLCGEYVEAGFLAVASAARKTRKYSLGKKWKVLMKPR